MSGGAPRIGFLGRRKEPDYLRRLARLRWRRRFPSSVAVELDPEARAREKFQTAETWVVIRDDTSLPVPVPGGEMPAASGRVLFGPGRAASAPPVVHTLRELEEANVHSIDATGLAESFPAIAFRPSDFPAGEGETVSGYVERLLSSAQGTVGRLSGDLSAIVFDGPDPGPAERTEVTRNFPQDVRRLLDVGCGRGEASAALRRIRPELSVVGIEVDPDAANAARPRLGRVLEGDAMASLAALAESGERFDGFLFADVLEHLEDPVAALALARELALPGATLVASVPNVGHLSLVRDLIRGRFDPLPAGLADAGHLRWFTRSFLAEALEEAEWAVDRIDALLGAPAPDAEAFLGSLEGWRGTDRTSLTTYQWVAVAHPGTRDPGQGTRGD